MNTLVTGGTGFIGRALVIRLLQEGNRVTVLTRDKRKAKTFFNKQADVLEVDICNPESLRNLDFSSKSIDIIFHLAAALDYFGSKKKLFAVNVEGTRNILCWAEKNAVKNFIFVSSIEAMGTIKREDIPADENFTPKPVSNYGDSKLEAEKQVKRFITETNLNATILRLGNVYGLGSLAFIAPIANAILKRDALFRFLPVYKDRYLHPVYIEDAVEGIIKSIQNTRKGKTYILAGSEYATVETFFRLIAKALNANMDLQIKQRSKKDEIYLNLRKRIYSFFKRADLLTYFMAGEGERVHRAYSIEKAKQDLDYFPKVKLWEGVVKTIEWAKKEGLLVI
jgi:nucleoside-diphosphate-sugar epimerase